MKIIDLSKWERTTHFNFFKRMDYPHYNICVNLEIRRFLESVEDRRVPFHYAMIFAAAQALNQFEEFRYRIRGNQVVLHEVVHPSFTDMTPGSDLFKMVTVDMESSLERFVLKAENKAAGQQDYFVFKDVEGRDDLIYITSLPWVSFTSLSHTISFNQDDSVPRLAWGKHFRDGNQIMLPFSVQAHHSFVDGIHIGRYIEALQTYLNRI